VKFARAQPAARQIAFVQPAQLADRHRDEVVEIVGGNEGRGQCTDRSVVDRGIVADDRVHDLRELVAVAQAQRVRLGERIADDGVAPARTLVRPREHVAG
jgi:hypothetical protein